MGTNISAIDALQPRQDAARALTALRRIVRALRISTRSVEREVGISGAQLLVLQQLQANPGQSLGDLAERTFTHQSTISEVVGRLVDHGLVERRADESDARRAVLTISPAGQGVLARAPETANNRLVAALRRLTVQQQRTLAEGLEAWLAEAGMADEPAAMFFEPARRQRADRNNRSSHAHG